MERRPINVFLLDDELVLCDLLKRALSSREDLDPRYIEVPSGTGCEALKILESIISPPDLLFIDLRLNNGVSGFEVIDKAVKKFDKNEMFIVILTGCWEGSSDWDKSMEYLKEGKVDSIIGKWGIGTVLQEIDSVLSKMIEESEKSNKET